MIGETVGHYRVLESLGRGGMGVVWLAEDVRLNRRVALKFIRDDVGAEDRSAQARLVREARAASALDHPNVATIYEVGEWRGRPFIAMAWYDGETLADRIARGPVPIDEATSLLAQIAEGLARAHAAGIVHRDLKPGNVMVTREGVPKILDFGLAAYSSPTGDTEEKLTATHSTVGTVAYMAPEQAAGGRIDSRADVWALGVIAFELLAGRRPFTGANTPALLHSILYDDPPDLKSIRTDLPQPIGDLVARALRKDPDARLQSAAEFASALRPATPAPAAPAGRTRGRMLMAVAISASVVIAVTAAIVSSTSRQRRATWARDVAVPAATKLFDDEKIVDAYDLAIEAEARSPDDPPVRQLLQSVARVLPIRTEPPGAAVSYRDYGSPEAEWRTVGTTPIDAARVPAAYLTWRLEKPGFVTEHLSRWMGAPGPFPDTRALDVTLQPIATAPPGMVYVPALPAPIRPSLPGLEHFELDEPLPAFWIDRHEVTNAEFKKFVDAGGYDRREFWPPFVDAAGRAVPWDSAIARLVDSTGRHAPATWIQADFPADQAEHPVTGVSWYEAAAYARFAGRSLPSLYHWSAAADPRAARWLTPFSNFGGDGPRRVASLPALHQSGAFDMAGNVKEWVATATAGGHRYILGGAWDEPAYAFNDPDARDPFDRARTFGFRCALFPAAPSAAVMAPLPWATRDYRTERPVSDREFAIYRRQFAYDRRAVTATVTATDLPDWRREIIDLPAAYGTERFRIFLLLPRRGAPPYETVMFWPGSNAFVTRDIDSFPMRRFEFLLKSGRAIAIPEFKGTFSRQTGMRDSTTNPSATYRDAVIAWMKDFSRTIDYLETRRDLSTTTLAMVGMSWGAKMGAIVPAIEPRLKAQVLVAGGFALQRTMPEVDQINFASRVTIPTLMLNGRHDFYFPIESSQRPMFEILATPRDQKRWQLYEGGHGIPQISLIKETLDWLDRFQPLQKK